MENELVINKFFTSIVTSCDNIGAIDLRYYNEREKNLIAFRPFARKRTIKTSDFYARLSSNFKSSDEILPSGCKYYKKIGVNYKAIVIEEPPRIRTILVDTGIEPMLEKLRITGKLKQYGFENYTPNTANKGAYSFQLSFPYVVFIITLDQRNNLRRIKPFFRLHPMTSLTDYLFKAPLYNIPNDQSMCIGNVESDGTLIGSINDIIEKFWFNVYNHDYSSNIVEYQKTDQYEVHDYLSWMYFTQLDPMFIYNIKWLKYDRNVGTTIENMVRDADHSSNDQGMFKLLLDSAFQGNSSEIEKTVEERNVSYSVAIESKDGASVDTLSVGDELIFEGKKMYLYSIIGDNQDITFVELEDVEGLVIKVPFEDFEDGYETIYSPTFLTEAVVNGVTIKTDDVISLRVDGVKMYKKIKNLRLGKDGSIEAYIGSDHYLIENIEFDVIDMEKIIINGKVLTQNKVYSILQRSDAYGPIFNITKSKFTDVSINSMGEIIMKFETSSGYGHSINYNHYKADKSKYNFIEDTDVEEPKVAYYFDRLLFNKDPEKRKNNEHFCISKDKGVIVHESNIRAFIIDSVRMSHHDIVNHVLIEDGTRLFIPGISQNIDFKVGDPIIYFNWRNPEDMLYVAGITGFTVNGSIIYAIAKTIKGEKTFEIPMVSTSSCRVNVGAMVKVFSKCGDWVSGDKIKVKVAGFYNFPKKDNNTIIAFANIPNVKYPVAICSNLCTLWMNPQTIESFTRISMKDPKWKKMVDTPFDISKIKWQHGDFYKHFSFRDSDNTTMTPDTLTETTCFLTKRRNTVYGFDYSYITSWGNVEYGSMITKKTLDERKLRHGMVLPRIPIATPGRSGYMPGYPNMFGGYYEDVNSRITFKSDQFLGDF